MNDKGGKRNIGSYLMKKDILIKKYNLDTGFREERDLVAVEGPLTIFLNAIEIVTLMCSPENREELAIGYLLSEGLIGREDNLKISLEESQGLLKVESDNFNPAGLQRLGKRTITTGCGKGASFYNLNDRYGRKEIQDSTTVKMDALLLMMREFQVQSKIYRETGGVHSAAMHLPGRELIFREDVGRHNAVDKLLGYCVLHQYKMEGAVLYMSGRISSELVIKGGRMGIPVMVSRSAPTSLAVEIAEDIGLTLVGFARGKKANIYSHATRIE